MANEENVIYKLEQLLLSEDLEELSSCTDKFNIFNALKLQNNEIRHSNFLGWLMAPYETHKLGDYFLKEFLKSALQNYSLNNKIDIALNKLIFLNLENSEIRREYKNIDILVINRQNEFVCVIENKIWTGEHDNQLKKYASQVDIEFKDYKKLYIYLAPYNEDNCELIERNINDKTVAYIPMNYKQVCNVLIKTLKFKKDNINKDVRTFIEHYISMLERNIMGETDENIINLCRKIYRENKEAIDLIVKYADSGASKISEILWNIVKDKSDLLTTGFHNNEYIEFFQKEIANKYAYKDLAEDKQIRVYYLFWQKNRKVDFVLWVSQADKEQRKRIYDILLDNKVKLSENGMILNDFSGKNVEKMVVVDFIREEEYQNFEDMNENDLQLELTSRFKNIYEQKIRCLQEIFRENISKLP